MDIGSEVVGGCRSVDVLMFCGRTAESEVHSEVDRQFAVRASATKRLPGPRPVGSPSNRACARRAPSVSYTERAPVTCL